MTYYPPQRDAVKEASASSWDWPHASPSSSAAPDKQVWGRNTTGDLKVTALDFDTYNGFFGDPLATESKLLSAAKDLCDRWNSVNSDPGQNSHRQGLEEAIIIAQLSPSGGSSRSLQLMVLSSVKYTDMVQTRAEAVHIEPRNLVLTLRFKSNNYKDGRVRHIDREGLSMDGWRLSLNYDVRFFRPSLFCGGRKQIAKFLFFSSLLVGLSVPSTVG